MKQKRFGRELVWAGAFVWWAGVASYWLAGYSSASFWFWLVGIVMVAAGLWRRPTQPKFDRGDAAALVGLTIMMAPLYVWGLHQLPVQVNTDEIAIMIFAKQLATAHHPDLFGLSNYFYFPSLIFFIIGKLGLAMGGITLAHMRLVHALFGLATVPLSFLLFRQMLERRWAAVATIILSINHSLVMISRMAMRDNTGLFFELAALAMLIRGLKQRDWFWTFVGGVVAGLGWYTYFPGRVTIVVWLSFMLMLVGLNLRRKWRTELLKLAAVAIAGFLMMTLPLIIATNRLSAAANQYGRMQLLVYKEGRALQQQWVFAPNTSAGVWVNIKNGLTMFNNRVYDYGNIYPNYGHGFNDIVTGVLIWLGLAIGLVAIVRRRAKPHDWLMAVGLISLWLGFAFVVNKAPDYTRLLVILPFAAYWAAIAIRWLVRDIDRLAKNQWLRIETILGAVMVSAIVIGNLAIAQDFINLGLTQGNDVGSTARYVETLASRHDYRFYLAADDQNHYYVWGVPAQWHAWLSFFTADDQTTTIINPEAVAELPTDQSFSVLMNQAVWQKQRGAFQLSHPHYRYRPLIPGGNLVAIEVN